MNDFMILMAILLITFLLSKVSLSKTVYYSCFYGLLFILVIGNLLIFNNVVFAEVANQLAGYLDAKNIANSFAWRVKTANLDHLIEAIYFFSLILIAAIAVVASGFEHKRMHKQRRNGFGANTVCILLMLFGLWVCYFSEFRPTGSSSFDKFFRTTFSSVLLLFLWQLFLFYLAQDIGMFLRAVFTKNKLKD